MVNLLRSAGRYMKKEATPAGSTGQAIPQAVAGRGFEATVGNRRAEQRSAPCPDSHSTTPVPNGGGCLQRLWAGTLLLLLLQPLLLLLLPPYMHAACLHRGVLAHLKRA